MDPSREIARRLRPTTIILAALFAICGIWLAAYSLGILHSGPGALPKALSWAWNPKVTAVFFLLAPAIWVAMRAGEVAGALIASVNVGCICAAFYLGTSVMLLVKRAWGLSLAVSISLGSTAILAYENASVIRNGISDARLIKWIAALLGYACLTFALWRTLRRVIASTKTDGPEFPKESPD